MDSILSEAMISSVSTHNRSQQPLNAKDILFGYDEKGVAAISDDRGRYDSGHD